MDDFLYREGRAYCEEVPLAELAREYGTPLYVYSRSTLLRHCRRFVDAFRSYPTLPCYAVKANSNLSLLREVFSQGFGADIVSIGELERALLAGVKPDTVVFSGVGKKKEEVERGLEVGILAFNVESQSELKVIQAAAQAKKKTARVSIRLNPNIEVKTHPHIATGLYATKFGVSENVLDEVVEEIKGMKELSLVGIDCHIGSQILDLGPFQQAARRLVDHAKNLKKAGFPIEHVDVGGGFGIRYSNEEPPEFQSYADAVIAEVKDSGFKLVLEPGRVVVGNAGCLLTEVLYEKKTPTKNFVIVDAAMNDLIRPSLYDAYHEINIVDATSKRSAAALEVDVVGPVCETGDFLGLNRKLPHLESGELLFIRSAGAYGMSMASNYNTRPRAAEVLVDKDEHRLIRRRETLTDLWAHEELGE